MFKNYIKIAWRNLVKNRFFTLLNIGGLAISLTVAILLFSYAKDQLSYNKDFSQADNLYRVNMTMVPDYDSERWVNIPNAVGPAMLNEIPAVKDMARLVRLNFGGTASLRTNNENYLATDFYLTDEAFFRLFDFKFIEKSTEKLFQDPNSIVISASESKRLFGDESALNKRILVNQNLEFNVTGVFHDIPKNSSFDGRYFSNIMDSWMGKQLYWANASYETYCLLHENINLASVEKQATALIDKHVSKEDQYYVKFNLQSIKDVFLYSNDLKHAISSKKGNINNIQVLFLLAVLIIGIACINYMNLATARYNNNTKEVGVNKALGASQQQIQLRFYIETALINLIAIVTALALAYLLLPLFNNISESSLSVGTMLSANNIAMFFLLWLGISLLGGSYPALLMSRLPTLGLMKQWTRANSSNEIIRKSLVVFQFSCSIILIIGVIVMTMQLRYINEKDLGYESKDLLSISIRSVSNISQLNSLKESIQNVSGTASVAALQSFPGFNESGKNIQRPGQTGLGLPTLASSSLGEVSPTLGLHMLAGKDLPKQLAKGDSTCYILINEIVAQYLGYKNPEDAVGRVIETEMAKNSVITGVIRNFHFLDLKETIGGYMYYHMHSPNEGPQYLLVRQSGGDKSAYLEAIKKVYAQSIPEAAFDYQYISEHLADHYQGENKTAQIIRLFSLLTIGIACLGLFGLAAFTAEQRKKEIGIRKVLGASTKSIMQMLSNHFFVLVIIAMFIAFPISWWLFSEWLTGFSYHISIPWSAFAYAGAFTLLIACIPIAFQAFKAAKANPVDSLRDE
ncbi:ABC transporter permease [Sphingobacterium sp. UT-1RO-CII-1]|uniref:ABC transporter permease n=1 Tax=Sphingobacterium sp. UT-1RO-CII-1 TaxID=2995225 RepID=UPI00227C7ED1|nr:ABC transporter permease [Sphingobacterium sp. UT-1RO-CII-1]MCY4778062.1 ABC transporter permease [Sphingobacterium sp. UT-1RO-CII-1]